MAFAPVRSLTYKEMEARIESDFLRSCRNQLEVSITKQFCEACPEQPTLTLSMGENERLVLRIYSDCFGMHLGFSHVNLARYPMLVASLETKTIYVVKNPTYGTFNVTRICNGYDHEIKPCHRDWQEFVAALRRDYLLYVGGDMLPLSDHHFPDLWFVPPDQAGRDFVELVISNLRVQRSHVRYNASRQDQLSDYMQRRDFAVNVPMYETREQRVLFDLVADELDRSMPQIVANLQRCLEQSTIPPHRLARFLWIADPDKITTWNLCLVFDGADLVSAGVRAPYNAEEAEFVELSVGQCMPHMAATMRVCLPVWRRFRPADGADNRQANAPEPPPFVFTWSNFYALPGDRLQPQVLDYDDGVAASSTQ